MLVFLDERFDAFAAPPEVDPVTEEIDLLAAMDLCVPKAIGVKSPDHP